MPKKSSKKPSKPKAAAKSAGVPAPKASKLSTPVKAVVKPASKPTAPAISNEQRIKSALKKLAGTGKNTPAVFKLPSRRATPMAFSLNEVRDLLKEKSKKGNTIAEHLMPAASLQKTKLQAAEELAPQKQRVLKGATLDDLLGGSKKNNAVHYDESKVPAKWMPFFKKLIALKERVTQSVGERSAQTLKTSVKESAGDLSSYDMADAGTDTFDYDYSLNLVSSEQEMIREIDAALDRIFDGTYGICEVTGKPINRDRLNAVPFTRFSKEGQDQYEKTRHKSVQRVGINTGDEDSEDAAATSDEGSDSE